MIAPHRQVAIAHADDMRLQERCEKEEKACPEACGYSAGLTEALQEELWGGQSWPQPPFRRLLAIAPSRQPAESRLQPGLAAPPMKLAHVEVLKSAACEFCG